MLILQYPRCSTCRNALKYLDQLGLGYEARDITKEPPTVEELKEWVPRSGLPLRRFFNTSGNVYRELGLKDTLDDMTEDEQMGLLSSNGMLVKRPLLVTDDQVLVGFKAEAYDGLKG